MVERESQIYKQLALHDGLTNLSNRTAYQEKLGLVMSPEDLKFCQAYFRDQEKRNPTLTEMKVIDTYWSDHCRHTTFLTSIDNVSIEDENELKEYNPELVEKDYIVSISKSDLLDQELKEAISKEFPETIEPLFFSGVTQEGLSELKDVIWKKLHG